ncbi:MAG: plastocyanin/azurin family copper-binding protein [Bacteroidia bacterium]|nr:plastocyanin/azurin family copper-binding protein [Bacteroidia bacterium]|tara:strand:- start:12698 stop:13201 length:504 start_codon:yes stop_codon:yes gene_type:complete
MRNLFILYVLFLILGCGGGNQQSGFENDEPITSAPIAKSKIITSDTLFIDALGANMSEMKFNKKVIRVPANKNITIALTNESSDATMPHNIVIIKKGFANDVGQAGLRHKVNAYVKPNDQNVIANSPLAQIGETVYFSFKTPEIGNYEFICSYPGHWGLMKGEFITK